MKTINTINTKRKVNTHGTIIFRPKEVSGK